MGYSQGVRKESDSTEQLNICIILANLVFHNRVIVCDFIIYYLVGDTIVI